VVNNFFDPAFDLLLRFRCVAHFLWR